jgi:hypothetical protein
MVPSKDENVDASKWWAIDLRPLLKEFIKITGNRKITEG